VSDDLWILLISFARKSSRKEIFFGRRMSVSRARVLGHPFQKKREKRETGWQLGGGDGYDDDDKQDGRGWRVGRTAGDACRRLSRRSGHAK
jgi:hypothetical protein